MVRRSRKGWEPSPEEYIQTIERRKAEFQQSLWLEGALGPIVQELERDHATHVRCLALGAPTEWQNAQYQFAFLILLVERMGIDPHNVSLWDPLFSEVDVKVMQTWGYTVVEKIELPSSTLFYVPHGPISLNIALSREVHLFLGNDMSTFVPRVEISIEDEKALDILRTARVMSLPVKSKDRWFTAMNDTALHIVRDTNT